MCFSTILRHLYFIWLYCKLYYIQFMMLYTTIFKISLHTINLNVQSALTVSSRPSGVRLQMSNNFYESSGQWWFSVESVSLLYNSTEEAVFNASEVYAPASSSYHCIHVSSLQRYSALLLPSSEPARRWSVTFTNFQVLDTRWIKKKLNWINWNY